MHWTEGPLLRPQLFCRFFCVPRLFWRHGNTSSAIAEFVAWKNGELRSALMLPVSLILNLTFANLGIYNSGYFNLPCLSSVVHVVHQVLSPLRSLYQPYDLHIHF